jgi:hypothetical protein
MKADIYTGQHRPRYTYMPQVGFELIFGAGEDISCLRPRVHQAVICGRTDVFQLLHNMFKIEPISCNNGCVTNNNGFLTG